MLTRRRILFGVVALALPVTGFAVFGTPAMFAGAVAPAFPVACKITATVDLHPRLDQGRHPHHQRVGGHHGHHLVGSPGRLPLGRAEPKRPATALSRPLTVKFPATKLGPRTYATGYCPGLHSAPPP